MFLFIKYISPNTTLIESISFTHLQVLVKMDYVPSNILIKVNLNY